MRPMYIIDLDDNIGQVKRKCPTDQGELRLMSVDREGKPASFMTPKQSALFELLRTTGDVVACTGRDFDGLQRMRIPLGGHAIVSFGAAIVMPDGSFEQRWARHVKDEAAQAASALGEIAWLAQHFAQLKSMQLEVRLITECLGNEHTELFVLVKQRSGNHAELDELQAHVQGIVPFGWKQHRNSSTLAFLPPFLRKGLAVQFLLNEVLETKPLFTVGIGDSTDDGGFMALCDFAMMPTNSQIFGLIRKEVDDVSR